MFGNFSVELEFGFVPLVSGSIMSLFPGGCYVMAMLSFHFISLMTWHDCSC
jgi:hypothetical protein